MPFNMFRRFVCEEMEYIPSVASLSAGRRGERWPRQLIFSWGYRFCICRFVCRKLDEGRKVIIYLYYTCHDNVESYLKKKLSKSLRPNISPWAKSDPAAAAHT